MDIVLCVISIVASTLGLVLLEIVLKDKREIDRICATLEELKNTQL